MNSKDILYSSGNNDECFTPAYGVAPIIKYIPKDAVVWCPFDTIDSEYVRQIENNGNKVIYSSLLTGQDFYTYQPAEHWDIIISNPPFTNKRKIFERSLSFNKPFALLFSLTWLNDSAPKNIFLQSNKQPQILMFDKRIKFLNNGVVQNKITFSSGYLCWNFLPEDLIYEYLEVY